MEDYTNNSSSSAKLQAIRTYLGSFSSPDEAMSALQSYVGLVKNKTKQAQLQKNQSSPVLLRADNIRKTYKIGKQKLEVLKGISLELRQGEFIAITGASGSGKSTLLQLLGGLDKPSSGEIYYGDLQLSKMSDRALSSFRSQTTGFIFQFFYLQPFLRLDKNIEVASMFVSTKRKQRKSKVLELAGKVDLADRLNHLPKELSGGQMQRAAIARALMNQPKILLADEPTGNLDSTNSKSIVDLFASIREQYNTTVVVVTHDPNIAARADREIKVRDGEIIV